MEPRIQRAASRAPPEPDLFLQWGNRKRLRCVKVRDDTTTAAGLRRTVKRRGAAAEKELHLISSPPTLPHPHHRHRTSESAGSESRKPSRSASPEKEDRLLYPTRGSAAVYDESSNVVVVGGEEKVMGLPRFFLSLSNKEKEEDFMAMKGCKLPQRPKKRSKFIQKSILLVSPGAWLTDLSQERYEVREKKSSKKRKRGLKAMCMESTDSE